jgi:hypothetical protein
LKKKIRCEPVQPSDVSALLKYKNGISRKEEIYYGSSFLSQSGRFINLDDQVIALEITDNKGNTRKINLQQTTNNLNK